MKFVCSLQPPLLHSKGDRPRERHRPRLKMNTMAHGYSRVYGHLHAFRADRQDRTFLSLLLEALFSMWEDLPEDVKDVLQGSLQQRTNDRNQGLGW